MVPANWQSTRLCTIAQPIESREREAPTTATVEGEKIGSRVRLMPEGYRVGGGGRPAPAGGQAPGMPELVSMPMTPADLVDRLAALPQLKQIPRPELEWLVEHGSFERRRAGMVVAPRGLPIEHLWIVLSGEMSISVDRGAGPRQVMRWTSGDVTGMLPYSRMKGPPGDSVVDEEAELVGVGVEHFPELVHCCPRFTAQVVRGAKVGPSPAWLSRALDAVGQRPINNLVDVTN